MGQFYLLSVVSLVVAGFALAADYLAERISVLRGFRKIRESRAAEAIVGTFATLAGILKLIFRSPGETTPVAGDLLPALAGIALGMVLLGEVFHQQIAAGGESLEKASRSVLTYRTPIGIAGVLIGLVHFVMPRVVIL